VRTFAAGPLFVYEWGRAEDPAVLYWDGLGGTGLHANELAPLLVEQGLRVIAPDPPGHGRSETPDAEAFRPSRLAATAAQLLSELGVERATFLGFSWGGRVAVWFAARYPERTAALALVEGGHHGSRAPAGLEAAIAEAQVEREEETFDDWDAFFAYERESLRRWTPALEEAHRALMREEDGRVAPIATAEVVGAINEGSRQEPLVEAYPAIAAAELPVLLVVESSLETEAVGRFRAALPDAQVEAIPDAIHDLVSFAPEELAARMGRFLGELRPDQPPP
jgi:pimeloyl-ACP methyl ester carboxylesterase